MRENQKKNTGIFNIFVGVVLALCILLACINRAENKPFWDDEGYEIVFLSEVPYLDIIKGKINQPSKNPLYFLMQKSIIGGKIRFDSDILVIYRLISIVSAAFIALLLYFYMSRHLGMFWAFIFIIALSNQHIFYHFAAENRYYMCWVLFFSALMISTTNLCLTGWENVRRRQKVYFALSAIGVTLVISMGVIQVLLSLLTCLFFWMAVHSRPKNLKYITHFALPLGLLCIVIELYYGLQGVDAGRSADLGFQFDLFHNIQNGNFSLLKMPGRLLLPKPGRDAFLGTYLFNLLAVFGVGGSLLHWKNRRELKGKELFAFTLNTIVVIQAVVGAILIGCLIGVFHYFFVQRIFLYLIVCHAILTVTGGYLFLVAIKNYCQKKNMIVGQIDKPKIMSVLAFSVLIILLFLSVKFHKGVIAITPKNQMRTDCLPIPGKLPKSFNSKNTFFHPDGFNFIVKVDRYINECSVPENGHGEAVYLWTNSTEWFLSPEIPIDGEPFKFLAPSLQRIIGNTPRFTLNGNG